MFQGQSVKTRRHHCTGFVFEPGLFAGGGRVVEDGGTRGVTLTSDAKGDCAISAIPL
jgi:hypothetical protein